MGQPVSAPKQIWTTADVPSALGDLRLYYKEVPDEDWPKGFYLVRLIQRAPGNDFVWGVECVFDGMHTLASIGDLGEVLSPMEVLVWASL